MKNFLYLVNSARHKDCTLVSGEVDLAVNSTNGMPIIRRAGSFNRDRLLDLVPKTSVICFSKKVVDKYILSSTDISSLRPEVINLPFKTCSFEMEGYGVGGTFIINELAPLFYELFVITSVLNSDGSFSNAIALLTGDDVFTSGVGHSIALAANTVRSEFVGDVTVNEVVKLNTKSIKSHRIRKIVYIDTKKNKTASINNRQVPVDWSHRWSVRGHWRKVDGLGKDRDDNYSVWNYTWVKDHVKGPEEKLFVMKTRLVRPGRQDAISSSPRL